MISNKFLKIKNRGSSNLYLRVTTPSEKPKKIEKSLEEKVVEEVVAVITDVAKVDVDTSKAKTTKTSKKEDVEK